MCAVGWLDLLCFVNIVCSMVCLLIIAVFVSRRLCELLVCLVFELHALISLSVALSVGCV